MLSEKIVLLLARILALALAFPFHESAHGLAALMLGDKSAKDAGRITMNFKNSEGKKFTLMEEKSSWDSSAVLSNYVKKNWGSDYSIAKGQGLTIYVSKSNAAWVNGGVFYVILDGDNALSSSDLHDIAVSL